jgi:hypothetical protein
MLGRKLATLLMGIGLSLAWKAASAETMAPTAPYAEKAAMPVTNQVEIMTRTITSLYHDAPSVLPALQKNWWTEPSAEIRVMTVSPQAVRSRTKESISRITDVTWGSWQRPR